MTAVITCIIGFFLGAFMALIISARAYDRGKADGLRLANDVIDNFIKQREEKDGKEVE